MVRRQGLEPRTPRTRRLREQNQAVQWCPPASRVACFLRKSPPFASRGVQGSHGCPLRRVSVWVSDSRWCVRPHVHLMNTGCPGSQESVARPGSSMFSPTKPPEQRVAVQFPPSLRTIEHLQQSGLQQQLLQLVEGRPSSSTGAPVCPPPNAGLHRPVRGSRGPDDSPAPAARATASRPCPGCDHQVHASRGPSRD